MLLPALGARPPPTPGVLPVAPDPSLPQPSKKAIMPKQLNLDVHMPAIMRGQSRPGQLEAPYSFLALK